MTLEEVNPRDLEISTLAGGDGSYVGEIIIAADAEHASPFDTSEFVFTTPEGKKFYFDPDGKVKSVVDLNKNTLAISRDGIDSYSPDANGVLQRTGKSFRFFRDDSRFPFITRICDPSGLDSTGNPVGPAVLKYDYDRAGNLLHVQQLTDRLGSGTYNTTTYRYDYSPFPHYITQIIDPRGSAVLKTTYWDDGTIKTIENDQYTPPLVTTFTHNATTKTEAVTDPQGNQTIHVYDNRGSVTQTTVLDPAGTTLSQLNRTYSDSVNPDAVTSETDGLGHTTQFQYFQDGKGNIQKVTDPLGHITETLGYNSFNQPLGTKDPRGQSSLKTTLNQYDANGNLTQTTDTMNNYRQQTYAGGKITSEIAYDSSGTELSLVSYAYFANGDLQSETVQGPLTGNTRLPLKSSIFTYDANGNRISETVQAYDVSGNPANAQTTTYIYDAQNRVVETRDPLYDPSNPNVHTTKTTFNSIGRSSVVTDSLGRQTLSFYDSRANLVQTTYPDGTITRTVFDGNSRVIYAQDRHRPGNPGLLQTNTCDDSQGDALPNQAETASCGGTHTVYDALGRAVQVKRVEALRIRRTDSGEVSEMQYVSCSELAPVSFTSTEFDLAGRVASTTDARGLSTFYGYDDAGRRTSVHRYDDNAQDVVTRFTYDENGNQQTVIDPKGQTTTYTVDDLNRVTLVTLPASDVVVPGVGTGIQTPSHIQTTKQTAYDALGRRVQETDAAGVISQFFGSVAEFVGKSVEIRV